MSDGGYWVNSPENPFNQMDYTRGGGGYDNAATTESNANRAFAMSGSGNSMPRYANKTEAQKALDNGNVPAFESIAQAKRFAAKYGISGTLKVGHSLSVTVGNPAKATPKPVAGKPAVKPKPGPGKPNSGSGKPGVKAPATDPNGKPVPANPGGVGPATPNPQTVGPVGAGPGREMTGVFGGSGAGSKLVISNPEALADPVSLGGGDGIRYLELGTWPGIGPVSWAVGPNFADAQDVEDIYGDDVFSWPALAVKSVYDTGINIDRLGNHLGTSVKPVLDTVGGAASRWVEAPGTPYVETRVNPFAVVSPPY